MNDWKRAAHFLVKKPAFSAVVVLTLAFGIGANATVWCWIDHLVTRPLPGVARQDELVVLVSSQGGGNVSELDLRDFAELPDVFAGALMSQTQRTQELGVRLALGATGLDVVWLVLRQGLVLTAAGVTIGVVLSLGLTRLVASFLSRVSPFDPATYAAVAVFLAIVALLASGLPARRATRVDPIVALR